MQNKISKPNIKMEIQELSINEFLKNKKLKEEKNRYELIDVRTNEEYENGHIPNSKNIPLNELKNYNPEKEEIIVYCRTDKRSRIGAEYLKQKYPKLKISIIKGGYLEYLKIKNRDLN